MAYNKTIAINILSRIAKNQGLLLGLALTLLFTGITLATSTTLSASPGTARVRRDEKR